MSIAKYCVVAVALLTFPVFVGAQRAAKPPKPGTAANPAIAYQARGASGWIDLMVMDADGKNQTRLMSGGDNMAPSWSPDGEWIAFARTFVDDPGIYMIRRNGTGLCMVVPLILQYAPAFPTWSPYPALNGHYQIVYSDRAAGETRTDLFVADAVCSANEPRRLTNTSTADENFPAWSQGNVLAATVAEGSGNGDIHVFNISVDTSGNIVLGPGQNLTASGPLGGIGACCAAWTQDGHELVVTGGSVSVDLWVISASSPGVATRLTDTPSFFERRPTWSPTFTKLAFDANNGIYTADVSAGWSVGQPTLLVQPRRGSVAFPSWRPVP